MEKFLLITDGNFSPWVSVLYLIALKLSVWENSSSPSSSHSVSSDVSMTLQKCCHDLIQ